MKLLSLTMMLLNPNEMLTRGLSLVGYNQTKQNRVNLTEKLARFSADFGKEPAVLSRIWSTLQQTENEAALIENATDKDFRVFLWTFHWFKLYPSFKSLAGRAGWCSKTLSKYIKQMIKKISSLKDDVIVWPQEWNDPSVNTPIFIISVDGTHCPIQEPTTGHPYSKNPQYYSHKFHRAGLAYEVALSIFTSDIVWVNGPFPAGTTDTQMFQRPNGLLSRIPAGKRVVADAIYKIRSLDHVLSTPNRADSDAVKLFKRRVRSRQEHTFTRMKVFKILKAEFEHGQALHKQVFEAILVTCQFETEFLPFFDV